MDRMVGGHVQTGFEQLLLADNHVDVIAYQLLCRTMKPRTRRRKHQAGELYDVLFEPDYSDDEITFDQEILFKYPCLQALNNRKRFLLGKVGIDMPTVTNPGNPEEIQRQVMTADLSVSEKRLKAIEGGINTLRPKSENFINIKNRMMLGREAFHMQGIFLSPAQDCLSQYTDRQKIDLAGNAFQAHCCMSVTLTGPGS